MAIVYYKKKLKEWLLLKLNLIPFP
jgi:hypothetical protein